MDSKWWTLGSANLLEANQLQSVIEAAYSLIRLGEVKSAESLLKPFASELAEVGPTVDHSMAMTWPSSGQTNGRSAL
jgi:hypothetical protein